MIVYFKNAMFVLFICLSNLPIGSKAVDAISREKDRLIPKNNLSNMERESDNKARLKKGELTGDKKSEKLRNTVNIIVQEFENFEFLQPQEQKQLLDKWEEYVFHWLYKASFARYGLMDKPLEVSDDTWEKLRSIQSLYPKKEPHCNVF